MRREVSAHHHQRAPFHLLKLTPQLLGRQKLLYIQETWMFNIIPFVTSFLRLLRQLQEPWCQTQWSGQYCRPPRVCRACWKPGGRWAPCRKGRRRIWISKISWPLEHLIMLKDCIFYGFEKNLSPFCRWHISKRLDVWVFRKYVLLRVSTYSLTIIDGKVIVSASAFASEWIMTKRRLFKWVIVVLSLVVVRRLLESYEQSQKGGKSINNNNYR